VLDRQFIKTIALHAGKPCSKLFPSLLGPLICIVDGRTNLLLVAPQPSIRGTGTNTSVHFFLVLSDGNPSSHVKTTEERIS